MKRFVKEQTPEEIRLLIAVLPLQLLVYISSAPSQEYKCSDELWSVNQPSFKETV